MYVKSSSIPVVLQYLWKGNLFHLQTYTASAWTDHLIKRPSFLNTCFYEKIKENSMIDRSNHSKQKSSVLWWVGISQGTSVREFSEINWVPSYHVAVIFPFKQRTNSLKGCTETDMLLGEPMGFSISCHVLLKCLGVTRSVLSVGSRQQFRSWSTLTMLAQAWKPWVRVGLVLHSLVLQRCSHQSSSFCISTKAAAMQAASGKALSCLGELLKRVLTYLNSLRRHKGEPFSGGWTTNIYLQILECCKGIQR